MESGGGSHVKWVRFSASPRFTTTDRSMKTEEPGIHDLISYIAVRRRTTTLFFLFFPRLNTTQWAKDALTCSEFSGKFCHLVAAADTSNNTHSEFTVGLMNETITGTQVVPIYKHKAKPAQVQKFTAL